MGLRATCVCALALRGGGWQEAAMAIFRLGAKPWMDAAEVTQLESALLDTQPKSALEWGCGGSTRFILETATSLRTFVSVEHDTGWHKIMSAQISDPRLSLHLAPPAKPEPRTDPLHIFTYWRNRWRRRAEVDPELFAAYVALPATLHPSYDFIFVDGRARSLCLAAGWKLLAPGGCMMLHDAQRPEYQEALDALPAAPEFLTPWKRGQMCKIAKPA